MYTYPSGQLDRPDALLGASGSFWSRAYGGSDLAAALLYARLRLDAQAAQDRSELADAVSRLTVPVLHTELWHPLVLSESDRNAAAAVARFDASGAAFDDGALYFDAPAPGPGFAFPAPGGLAHLPLLCNRTAAPSLAWVRGADYTLSGGVLWFREDPFASPLVTVQEVWDGPRMADRRATLWGFRAGFDRGEVYRQFGAAAGVYAPGTPAYRDAVNAALDNAALGANADSVRALLSAALGVPMAASDERVEDVFYDARGLCVVTDLRAYRFARGANPVVSPGDRVAAGDPLTDALTLQDFGRGGIPEGLRAFACGRGVLAEGYHGELVFEDREVPLEVGHDPQGRARVSFALGGHPADVRKFWDDVHAAGVARGRTLARLLDVRPVPVGEPSPQSLPASVNPLAFLCRNVLRCNAVLARVRAAGVDPAAPGWGVLRALRGMVPPHTLLVLLVELGYADAPVTMGGPGDATRPGYAEAVSLGPGSAAAESVDPSTYVAESVTLSVASAPCA